VVGRLSNSAGSGSRATSLDASASNRSIIGRD
jgi:hypothetical protein